MTDLLPGQSFMFRHHPRWRFWNRGYGGAKVLAREPSAPIVHLYLLGMEPDPPRSLVNFLPILETCVSPFVAQFLTVDDPAWRQSTHAWAALSEWRDLFAAKRASCFGVPLGRALGLVEATWRQDHDVSGPMRLASAFPVPGPDGRFTTVRISTYV